jgi:hypothetical protein
VGSISPSERRPGSNEWDVELAPGPFRKHADLRRKEKFNTIINTKILKLLFSKIFE